MNDRQQDAMAANIAAAGVAIRSSDPFFAHERPALLARARSIADQVPTDVTKAVASGIARAVIRGMIPRLGA